MSLIRSSDAQVKVFIWVAVILLIMGVIGMGIAFLLGERSLIQSMYMFLWRFGPWAVAGIIAYLLLNAIVSGLFK